MFELFVTAFVMLFLVIDPIGLLPIFISLTHGNNKNRLKIGLRACSVALGILLLFGLLGENLLNFITTCAKVEHPKPNEATRCSWPVN